MDDIKLAAQNPRPRNRLMVVLFVAILLLGAAGAGYYYFAAKKKTPTPAPITADKCADSPVIASFTADPAAIEPGATSILKWEVTGPADSIVIDQNVGAVLASGSTSVTPATTTTYLITVICGAKNVTSQATVTVTQKFAVTSAAVKVDHSSAPNIKKCTETFVFTATIKANKAGTVKYKWQRSEGYISAEKTLTFSAAGAKTVIDSWVVPASVGNSSMWERIKVQSPNALTSANSAITVGWDFRVCSVTGSVSPKKPTTPTAACPNTTKYTFTFNITINKGGTLHYKYEWSDGTNNTYSSSTLEATYQTSGTKTITKEWVHGGDDDPGTDGSWYRLVVTSPNSISSNTVYVDQNCGAI